MVRNVRLVTPNRDSRRIPSLLRLDRRGQPALARSHGVRRVRRTAVTLLLASVCLPTPVMSQDWPFRGGDPGGQNYSPLRQIHRDNVSTLRLDWTWETGEHRGRFRRWLQKVFSREPAEPGWFEATPIMIGDTLYLSTPLNRVVALDAESGRLVWRYDPGAQDLGPPPGRSGFVHRGVASWSDGSEHRIFMTTRWSLIALDAASGQPVQTFGTNGRVDLADALDWPGEKSLLFSTSPPVLYDSLIIVGSSIDDYHLLTDAPPGTVQAFDVRTGRPAWSFRTIPRLGEEGSETWDELSNTRQSHANVWAPMTVDTARGLVFLPVGAAANDWYGGDRPGDGLFAESLVCLDARTGELEWYFQIVHHGLWDYDLAAPPALVTTTAHGRRTDAVAVAGKTGFLYVFDRVTGEPIWPIEERPVPGSHVPGERASPTQPVPTRPPPFAKQGFTEDDVIDFSPELRALALEKLSKYRIGPIFTPPSLEGTIVMPGWIGGAGWGGIAFDPELEVVFVKATNAPVLARLVPFGPADGSEEPSYRIDPALVERYLRPGVGTRNGLLPWSDDPELPINKPPYGTLTAIDLRSGELGWQVPIGDSPDVRDHPALESMDLPPLGAEGPPGAIVTAGGLIFITGGGASLYALDSRTGEVLWEGPLGARGYANPMTYQTRSGRQFVLIATGGGEQTRARVMAFAIPEG